MNRRVLWVLLSVVVASVVAAVLYRWNRRPTDGPAYVVNAEAPVTGPAPEKATPNEWDSAREGGVYSGTVVEAEGGAPIQNAQVLLISTVEDEKMVVESGLTADGGGEVQDIPVFGSFRVAARDTTNAKGEFRISAGSARVVALFAHEPGHGPGMRAHMRTDPLVPGPGHVLKLAKAGAVVGTVIDRVTRTPVPGVDVAIFLQHPANQDERGTVPFEPTSSFARFQNFIAQVIGPMVWGIEPRGNDGGLHLVTDREGRFSLRPLMREVQLEFVFTHPEYAWTDGDPEVALAKDNPLTNPVDKVLTRKRRTVVPPGQTVERTFELEKGKEISGTVTDEKGVPFEDVKIYLEHVTQYGQHHFYRTRTRDGKTDRKGRFRIAGLSYGPYVLRMTHPSFESKVFQPVPEASDQTYRISRGGWVDVDVAGGREDRTDFTAEIRLVHAGGGDLVVRKERVAVRDRRFQLAKVEPGRYDLSIASGSLVSAPVRLEVLPGEGAVASLELRSGGGFFVTVTSTSGAPLDPVSGEIEIVVTEGPPRRAGLVVSRGGIVRADGLTSGRYQVLLRAPGYVAGTTEPFDVAPERMTPLPTFVLFKPGFVKIASVKDEHGRTPGEGVIREFAILQSDGTPVPFGALGSANSISVKPGSTTVRVTTSDGRVFESKFDVAEGATVPVDVVLPPP